MLRFERRRPGNRPSQSHRASIPPVAPIGDAGEQADEAREDFRHRMKTNAATLVVVALLIWCGLWLADAIASLRKTQDCLLSGLRNCTPIPLSEHER